MKHDGLLDAIPDKWENSCHVVSRAKRAHGRPIHGGGVMIRDGDSEGDPYTSTSSSLLDRVKIRAPGAWERFVDLYAPMIYRWCRRTGVDDDDAPDVLQEVFLAVATHIGDFYRDRPGDTFCGWLRTPLHYLLVGRAPYTGETTHEILTAHQQNPIRSLRAERDDVPEKLDRVFQKMVAKIPVERHSSMTAWSADGSHSKRRRCNSAKSD